MRVTKVYFSAHEVVLADLVNVHMKVLLALGSVDSCQ